MKKQQGFKNLKSRSAFRDLKEVSLLRICGCICVCECFNKVCHQNAFISVDGGWRNFFLLLFCSFSLWLASVSPISFLGSLCDN